MANYRLKLARTNNFKARVSPRIPAQLVGGTGIEVERTNAVYTFSLDFEELPTSTAIASDVEATLFFPFWQSVGDFHGKISLTDLKTDISATFDGLYQPLDATLTALAALDSTAGLLTQTGEDTFERRSLAAPAAGFTITNPAGTAGNPTFVLANDLAAYEGLSTNGLVTRTGDGTATTRTLTAPAAGITVTNGDGVAGNPTLALANDLAAIEGLASTGLIARTGDGTAAVRTLTAPAAGITVSNGGGVAGNPTLALANDLSALEAMSGTGLVARTASETYAQRTLTAPAAGITVSNGNGVSGNPTLALADDLAALEALSGTDTIYYRSGANTWSAVTIGSGITFTGGSLAASGGGGSSTPGPPQGRLTLQTGVPVMTTTQSAKTTIYYTPYHGDQVPIYDGTDMTMTAVAEISVATTDTAKNPAAIGASKVNDWFVWNDGGTLRLSHGPDWTSDTVRSAGTALTLVNGIYLNNVSITNGPAASRGTYVGTTRSNSSSQLEWIFGASASGGTAGAHHVWNAYNRVDVVSHVVDSGTNYTYTSATIRQARASAGNQVSFVIGLSEDGATATYSAEAITTGAASANAIFGIGYDTITARSSKRAIAFAGGAFSVDVMAAVAYGTTPAIGVHYFAAVENGDGTNANAFDLGQDNTLTVNLRM